MSGYRTLKEESSRASPSLPFPPRAQPGAGEAMVCGMPNSLPDLAMGDKGDPRAITGLMIREIAARPGDERAGKGLTTSGIVSCDLGVVRSIVKKEHSFEVTLDNGVFADIPRDHPVRNSYLNQTIRFPHFTNNAIALVTHADTSGDWLPARVAISLRGSVIVKGTRYAFHDFTSEEFSKVYNDTRPTAFRKRMPR